MDRKPLSTGQLQGVPDRIPDRPLGGPPQQVDPGDMDDPPEGQPTCRGQDRPAQRDRPVADEVPGTVRCRPAA